MQSTQASLKQPLNVHADSLSIKRVQEGIPTTPHSSANKKFRGARKPQIAIPFSNETFPSISPTTQCKKISLGKDYAKATNCLLTIMDPLWKQVCRDVMSMMGVASFLKIWDSRLGEICSQDQSMEIHCQTEETAQFIQQYDFIILGSLQSYFPVLKQLRIKTAPTL